MTSRIKTAALALLTVLLCAWCDPAADALAGERDRPNIVFVMADDQRADMMSCAGNPYAKTPNLDRLAAEGMRFDRAFVTTAVCMPSRAAFFTGKYARNAGATTIIHMPHTFHRNQRPFTARLHDAGYHTAHFGKWHLGGGNERQPGYDHWAGYYASSAFRKPLITTNGKARKHKGFTDFVISRMAAEHIAEVAQREQPFFVFVGLVVPHSPFGSPKKYGRLFADVDIAKPASFDEDFAKTGKPRFLKQLFGIHEYKSGLKRFKTWDNYVKSYYRSSQSTDESVGMILDALDEAGVADDTLVIYSSDHGYALGEHGLTEKITSYEGVMRVPLLVRYPKAVAAGAVRQELVSQLDVAPTCLEMAGVEVPDDLDGLSLRPILSAGKGEVGEWRSDVFFDGGHHATVRTARHKYITYPYKPGPGHRPRARRDQPPELYDLETDPDEMVNLVGDAEQAPVLADMKRRLAAQMKAAGWTARVDQTVASAWLLGPVPAELETAVAEKASAGTIRDGAGVTVDGRTFVWKAVKADDEERIPIAELVGGKEGQRFLLGFQLELLAERDPFVRVAFTEKTPPLRGWVDGEFLFDRRTEGHPTRIQFGWQFNPPLDKGVNTLIFAGAAADFPAARISVRTWEGKTRLLP